MTTKGSLLACVSLCAAAAEIVGRLFCSLFANLVLLISCFFRKGNALVFSLSGGQVCALQGAPTCPLACMPGELVMCMCSRIQSLSEMVQADFGFLLAKFSSFKCSSLGVSA